MTHVPRIEIYPTKDELEQAAVNRIVRIVAEAIRERGACFIALSGGETPRRVYHRLVKAPIDWHRVHLWFGDERMVSPDDPQSNYGMVEKELLSAVAIPDRNVHRIRGEEPPGEAAALYAAELATAFSGATDRFDLVLLGLGEDGHTASLFPGMDVLTGEKETVLAVRIPNRSVWRVTLTRAAINDSRVVVFLVSGSRKAPMVRRLLAATDEDAHLPAAMVHPGQGQLFWMLDSEAGAELPLPS
jgi:6-phosphogluconolactonase